MIQSERLEKKEEPFFKAIFGYSMDAILVTVPGGQILAANPAACSMLGRSESEIISLGRKGLVDPSDERLPGLLAERVKHGKTIGELMLVRSDGSVFPVSISSSVFRNAEGEERTIMIIRDITKYKILEGLQIATNELLDIINRSNTKIDLIKSTIEFIRSKFKFEAAGIRIQEGDDYPYYESSGFPVDFIKKETFLCSYDKEGKIISDYEGNPLLDCMCGDVIRGNVDPSNPFFTAHGSFWTNSTTELLATTTDADRQSRTRNRCNSEGYESVALIPLRSGKKTFGLIQINDKRKGLLSPTQVSFFETIGDNLAIALDKLISEEALKKSEKLLRTLIENSRDGINMLDLKTGKYFMMSPSQVELTGFTEDEILNISREEAFERVHPDDRLLSIEQQKRIVAGDNTLGVVEYRWKVKSGEYHWFSDSRNVIRDSKGNAVALVVNSRDITEQKSVQDKLRRNEQLLREAQTVARIGNWDYDVKKDKPSWSDEMFKIFEMDPAKGEPSWTEHKNAVCRDDWEKLDKAVHDASSKGTPYSIEFRIVKPDKSLKWAHTIGKTEKDNNGKIFRLYGTVQDISARKQAELAYEKSEERFRIVTESAGEWIWEVDISGIYTYVSSVSESLLGYKPEEILGKKHFYDFFVPEVKPKLKKAALQVFERKESFRKFINPNVHKDGHIVILETSGFPVLDDNGNLIGYRGADTDITERKKDEEALAASEKKYHTLFEHSVVPIWEEDFSEVKTFFDQLRKKNLKDFRAYFRKYPEKALHCASLVRITDVNQSSLAFFGLKDKSEMLLKLPDFFTEESYGVFIDELITLAEGKTVFEMDLPIKMPFGKIMYVHHRLQVLPDHSETLSQVLVFWIDITDRINYEDILKQSSEELRALAKHIQDAREEERTRIARDLHDDLGQRLTALNMDISWLRSRIGVQSRAVENKLEQMVSMMSNTIETVQKISHGLRPSILDDLGLLAAIEWQVKDFKKTTGISCINIFNPKEINVDSKISLLVFRIVQEALTNVARHSEATKVKVKVRYDGNILEVAVKDNGNGIDIDKTESSKSFGLIGMRERVKSVEGEIFITGKSGKGTLVEVKIPLPGNRGKRT